MSVERIVGSTYRPLATFRDADGALYDPDDVTTTVRDPDGDLTHPAPEMISTGQWSPVIPITKPGIWFGDIIGTGPDDDVVIVRFTVCAKAELVGAGS